jgi:hypothetical protein
MLGGKHCIRGKACIEIKHSRSSEPNTESVNCSPPVWQVVYSTRKVKGGNMKMSQMIAIVAILFCAAHGFARTQCTCQTVNAVGEGNSSCSTAESNGKCTVDFNPFPAPVLTRAAAVLSSVDSSFSVSFTDANRDASFLLNQTRNAKQLAETVVLYMAAAATMQTDGNPALSYESSDLSALIAFAKSAPDLFESVFRKESQYGRSESGTHRSIASYTVAPGCMDIVLPRGLRVMFKAMWSPVAANHRCEDR